MPKTQKDLSKILSGYIFHSKAYFEESDRFLENGSADAYEKKLEHETELRNLNDQFRVYECPKNQNPE